MGRCVDACSIVPLTRLWTQKLHLSLASLHRGVFLYWYDPFS